MKTKLSTVVFAAGCIIFSNASAETISSGTSIGFNIAGDTSIYEIFGHEGSTYSGFPGGIPADGIPAHLLTFTQNINNRFTFSATGAVNCCGNATDTRGPDGGIFFINGTNPTNVSGINGLSSAIGNTQLPVVGVFTADADPFGGTPPVAMPWNASSPASLAPLLHQVFYIGDGRAGFNDAGGSILEFLAPSDATRLYIGFADAFWFNDFSGAYADNPGSMDVTANLLASPLPPTHVSEPGSFALFGAALLALTGLRRSRKYNSF